jgi:ABC-2 type transport system permease protein
VLRSVFAKVMHDQWRALLAWAGFCAVWPAMYVALYPSIGAIETLQQLLDQMPPAVRALFASSDLSIGTAEGYLNIELFSFVAPLLFMAYTVAAGGSATAGEEERGTIDLLLANPVPRWRVVAEKAAALAAGTLVIGMGIWLGVAAGAVGVGVELDLGLVAQAIASAGLLGLALGAFAMALGSLTGARWLSVGVAMAIAVAAFFFNALGALVEWLEPWRVVSPFYHYIANDPLTRGLDPAHAGVLAGLAMICFAVALIAFERRDLRG